MSGLPHDELEALIAADAMGGLDPGDRDRMAGLMAEHGPDCAECRRLVTESREAAAGLALALDPVPMSAGAEDRLLEAIRSLPRGSTSSIATVRRMPGRARRWVAAAAVAAAVGVLGGVIGYSLAPNAPGNLRTLALKGAIPGQLSLVYQPGRTEARLFGTGLADPGAGKVYELWYQPSPGAKMVPAGVFTPTAGSVAGAPVTMGRSFVLVAVTVEPGPSGSPQPTSTPILSAPA